VTRTDLSRRESYAIAGFMLGLVALVSAFFIGPLALPVAIVAVIVNGKGLAGIKGLAVTGIVVAVLGGAVAMLLLVGLALT
jgi:hypothetical protein